MLLTARDITQQTFIHKLTQYNLTIQSDQVILCFLYIYYREPCVQGGIRIMAIFNTNLMQSLHNSNPLIKSFGIIAYIHQV